MIRPLLMGAPEVNDWGQPWEKIKRVHSLTKTALSHRGGGGIARWRDEEQGMERGKKRPILLSFKALLGNKILGCFFLDSRGMWTCYLTASSLILVTETLHKPKWSSPTRLLFFFIIATNWKTIHHINIIAIFQKKRKTKIKQHLYTFLPRYWTTLIFTCSDEIGLEIILWQYDCTIRRESKHLQRKEINNRIR